MAAVHFLPYKAGSQSCAQLSLYTQIPRIKLENSKYVGRPDKTVINWGNPNPPECINDSFIVNPAHAIQTVNNKLTFFQQMSESEDAPRTPQWTLNKEVVRQWLRDGKTAFARTKLRAHSGRGIVDVINEEVLDGVRDGTLFVMYVPKKQEWRIHLMRHKDHRNEWSVVAQQKKVRPRIDEDDRNVIIEVDVPVNWRVRNHDNGFIFERNGGSVPPADVIQQACRALNASGLDFGAADVIYNERQGKAYVLEINSAPGLEGQTIIDYVEAFKNNGYIPREAE